MTEKENTAPKKNNPEDAALDIKTTGILMRLGVPVSCKGYEYLRCAVILAYHTPEITVYATKTLYPRVARLCLAADAGSVERNCRHAVERVFTEENRSILYEIFGVDITGRHPTCAQLISAIAKHLWEIGFTL